MRRLLLAASLVPLPVWAQTLVAVEPAFNPVPLVILLVCVGAIAGAIVLRRKNPALYAKLAGGAAKAGAGIKEAAADLVEEAHQMEDAIRHHPLAQPKAPYVPPVAPAPLLEVQPQLPQDDGILR